MSGLKLVKLEEFASFSQGIQVDINNQFSEQFDGCVRFIRIIDFTKGNNDEVRYIKNPGARYLVNDDDLVMIRYGSQTAGKIARGFSGAIANNTFKISLNKEIADNNYIFYFLSQDSVYKYFHNAQSSSTMPAITFGMIGSLDIELPNINIQKDIASVLSSLDDKIDLLHRQNATLEKMAEILFRQWFIEEDDNATIGSLVEIQNGYAFKSNDFKNIGKNSVIKIKNISGGIIDIERTDFIDNSVISKVHNKFKIEAGDILIAMTGAEIGKLGIIPQSNKDLWLNQRVGLLKEKYKGSKYLAYLQLKSEFGQDYIENAATGSAQPNISGTGIEACGFPNVSDNLIKEYSLQIGELYNKVAFNLGQINAISVLRDTLLPKLMSGEVTVEL